MKRLFLFSSFDKDDRVSEPLLNYLKHLARFGDIVFVADNHADASEIAKITPFVIHHEFNGRHWEYDWGSYKRGWLWARDNGILDKYDRVYMVNDSMYMVSPPGTTAHDALARIFENCETADVGGVYYLKKRFESRLINKTVLDQTLWNSNLQSWFIGISISVAQSKWFSDFITHIARQDDKKNIIMRYEVGFTWLCRRHGLSIASFLSGFKNWSFRQPLWLLQHGAPFIKKRELGTINAKVNLADFKKLGAPETDMIIDEIRRQTDDAEFAGLLARNRPYVYRRFGFFSVRRHYTPDNRYVSDWYIFRWRVAQTKS